jgi:hypothetical protein
VRKIKYKDIKKTVNYNFILVKTAYGDSGFSWNKLIYKEKLSKEVLSYEKVICTNTELLNEKQFLIINPCDYEFNEKIINFIEKTFHKVRQNLGFQN